MRYQLTIAWGTDVTTTSYMCCAPGERPRVGSEDAAGGWIMNACVDAEGGADCACAVCRPLDEGRGERD